jgi:hypothetical protein
MMMFDFDALLKQLGAEKSAHGHDEKEPPMDLLAALALGVLAGVALEQWLEKHRPHPHHPKFHVKWTVGPVLHK